MEHPVEHPVEQPVKQPMKQQIEQPDATKESAAATQSIDEAGSETVAPVAKTAPVAQAAPALVSVTEDGYYTLSLITTINQKKLRPVLKKVKAAGIEPVVREETRDTEVYRQIVESYQDRESAEKKRQEVAHLFKNAYIIVIDKLYYVAGGAHLSATEGEREKERLAKKGLQTKVVKYQVPLKTWRVTYGHFADAQQAKDSAAKLAALGIKNSIVKVGEGSSK